MADKGGLEGVVVARSRLCSIDGQRGILIYGGYDVNDLAEHASYEEVAFLILRGHLPTREELDGFTAGLTEALTLSDETARVIDLLASHAAPMEMLRTAVSADSVHDPDKDSNAEEANVRKATRLIGAMPAMVARYDRSRRGLEPIDPDPQLGHAANFLYMLSRRAPVRGGGEDVRRGADPPRRARDERLDVHRPRDRLDAVGHALGASSAAIGALKGPLHGGANEKVMECSRTIGCAGHGRASGSASGLARKERIMGFGHRVYKTGDPRAVILKRLSQAARRALGDEPTGTRWRSEIERAVLEEKELYPNVDFCSGRLYHYLARDRPLHADLRHEPGRPAGRRTSSSSSTTTA